MLKVTSSITIFYVCAIASQRAIRSPTMSPPCRNRPFNWKRYGEELPLKDILMSTSKNQWLISFVSFSSHRTDERTSLSYIDHCKIVEIIRKIWSHFSVSFSRIVISFKDTHFRIIKRSELYSVCEFLAFCGGFLELFIGSSVLSIVEIFYYLIFRAANEPKTQMKLFERIAWFRK